MNNSFSFTIEVSKQYDFSKDSLEIIDQNVWVKNQWPLIYFIQNEQKRIAYIGESTNASSRIRNHLSNPERLVLNKISIISSDKFNKSATLDIESNLIQYVTADGTYELQNGNFGLINHKYYQQSFYKDIFKEIWNKLLEKKIVRKTLTEIENSELFKYSPYKSLNEDQYNSILQILKGLTQNNTNRIIISGSAGTGKTILAAYIMKLLYSEMSKFSAEELNEDELIELNYVIEFRKKYKTPRIGLVIAMTSLRETLKNVFKNTPGLKQSMVLSPSDTFKNSKYDLLIVDEAHRLRQYKNIGWRGVFKKNNKRLGLDDTGTELDWILQNSTNQILFYDSSQSVKPSDVESNSFTRLLIDVNTLRLSLKSQMRVKGGNSYIEFVDELLNVKKEIKEIFEQENYDLLLFDNFSDLYNELLLKEKKYGLCRLVAGYSWEWLSDPKKKNPNTNAIDIEIDGLQFQWNQTDKDWICKPKDSNNPLKEIGCIHTVQGYDLNYTGVVFGREIDFCAASNSIIINTKYYYDKYGQIGASQQELKKYIVNIYKTLMYRGIKGTFVYAYNRGLRDYLKYYILTYNISNVK